MVGDDAMDCREAQPRAARPFGGEEGIEYPFHGGLIHTAPGVADRKPHMTPGCHGPMREHPIFGDLNNIQGNVQGAAPCMA